VLTVSADSPEVALAGDAEAYDVAAVEARDPDVATEEADAGESSGRSEQERGLKMGL
jgi:hypothetical protein